ncbi:MAG: ribosomal protein S18-alanine N-acetyltransferase [Hyphomicrobiales bacterium]
MTLVEKAGAAHVPVLAALHAASFDAPWSEEEFAKLLNLAGADCLIARHDSQPTGFILAQRVAEEAEIITICVLPELRQKGIGAELVTAIGNSNAGLKKIFIEVDETNTAGLALYRALGFTRTGVRKDYYRQQDGTRSDALMMTLALD